MRQKLTCLLLSGALALGLAACAAGEEAPSPGQITSQTVETNAPSQSVETNAPAQPAESIPPSRPVETALPSEAASLPPEPSDPSALEEDLPQRDYRPWQVGYMDFLTALAQAELDTREDEAAYAGLAVDQRKIYCMDAGEELGMIQVMAMGSEYYYLYDVDKDGVPELFVQYGSCEAAYTTQCYTYRDGQVVCIGELDMGHSSLYTHPDKSAVLRSEGHMGYHDVYEYPMEDGVLTEERLLFSEEDVRDYTPTDEIVPGAEHIRWLYTRRGEDDGSYWTGRVPYSAGKALLLPICDWGAGRPATGDSSETARTAILAALRGEGEVYGASGDHFNGDVGWVRWEDYAQANEGPRLQVAAQTVLAHVWQDMNGDGQEECVLQVETEIMRDGEVLMTGEFIVVLSEQDGTVYAYGFHHYYDAVFHADGTIRNYDGRLALSFWKDQCYEYYAEADGSAPAVKWVDGPPAG